MTAPSPEALEDAARRIERWLLTSAIQISEGPHSGAIAGWLDRHGRPPFAYLEATGYYLTSMAWLLAGGARAPEDATLAWERGRNALAWIASALDGGAVPPTRLYLEDNHDRDWRNAAVFSFDLAMAIRGVERFARHDPRTAAAARDSLAARLTEVRGDSPLLPSHAGGDASALPDRWSTRPGPHHVKASAALLSLPLDSALIAVASSTFAYWAEQLGGGWPARELHPLLYGLEGMAMLPTHGLDGVEKAFRRLMEVQLPDGSLPAELSDCSLVRSDVLAQALRIGALLRASGRLAADGWSDRLDRLAARLLEHVRPDGGVGFSRRQEVANAWCAMFAQQALVVHHGGGDALATLVRQYLV